MYNLIYIEAKNQNEQRQRTRNTFRKKMYGK